MPAQHLQMRPDQRGMSLQQQQQQQQQHQKQIEQQVQQHRAQLSQPPNEGQDPHDLQSSQFPQGKALDLMTRSRYHSMDQQETGLQSMEHRRALDQWTGPSYHGVQENERDPRMLASDQVGPWQRAPLDIDDRQLEMEEEWIKLQIEKLQNEQKLLQLYKQRRQQQQQQQQLQQLQQLQLHQDQQLGRLPQYQGPPRAHDSRQQPPAMWQERHRAQPVPPGPQVHHPQQQADLEYPPQPRLQYHPRSMDYQSDHREEQNRPVEGARYRNSIDQQRLSIAQAQMTHPDVEMGEVGGPSRAEASPQAMPMARVSPSSSPEGRFGPPSRPGALQQGSPELPQQQRAHPQHLMSFQYRSDSNTRPR